MANEALSSKINVYVALGAPPLQSGASKVNLYAIIREDPIGRRQTNVSVSISKRAT